MPRPHGRTLEKDRRLLGLCRCGAPQRPGFLKCDRCLTRHRESKRTGHANISLETIGPRCQFCYLRHNGPCIPPDACSLLRQP